MATPSWAAQPDWAAGVVTPAMMNDRVKAPIVQLQQYATPQAMVTIKGTAQAIPNNTWTAVTMASTLYSEGTVLTRVADGIQVSQAGLYSVSCSIVFSGNATGRRNVAISQLNPPNGYDPRSDAINLSSTSLFVSTAGIMFAAAGDTLKLMVLQDSGAALNVSISRLNVFRVA